MTSPWTATEAFELAAALVEIGFFVTMGIALKRWLDRHND